MIQKEPSKRKGYMSVTFELPSNMWAERVNLVGEFNDWKKNEGYKLRRLSLDTWYVTMPLKKGKYHYSSTIKYL